MGLRECVVYWFWRAFQRKFILLYVKEYVKLADFSIFLFRIQNSLPLKFLVIGKS